jgi:hypothetical protein
MTPGVFAMLVYICTGSSTIDLECSAHPVPTEYSSLWECEGEATGIALETMKTLRKKLKRDDIYAYSTCQTASDA